MDAAKTLIEEACRRTGLEDFGDDGFREGLERLVDSLDREASLNAVGEVGFRAMILGLLGQRLQVEDWYRRHPEIDDEPIERPLVGLGLPRTGSTALSCLLAEDPNARSLVRWEAVEPCPPPSTVRGVDPRLARAEAEEAEIAKLTPRMRALVPSTPTGPMECQPLMGLDFRSHYFIAMAHLPAYADWLVREADLTPTYHYERRVLKLLQWGEPRRRPWRLKNPSHLLFLEHFDRAFPDARFVMTHRDPSEVMVSVADVYATVATRFCDDIDLHYLGALNVDQWSLAMDRALAFREAGNDDRFFDLDFRRGATRSDRRGPPALRVARRAGERRLRGGHDALVARERGAACSERPSGARDLRARPRSRATALRALRRADGGVDRARLSGARDERGRGDGHSDRTDDGRPHARARLLLRGASRGSGDAREHVDLALRGERRLLASADRDRGGRCELGPRPGLPVQQLLRGRARVGGAGHRRRAVAARRPGPPDAVGRRAARVPPGRALQALADDLRWHARRHDRPGADRPHRRSEQAHAAACRRRARDGDARVDPRSGAREGREDEPRRAAGCREHGDRLAPRTHLPRGGQPRARWRAARVPMSRFAHQAPERPSSGRILRPLLAVGALPGRPRLRLHRVPRHRRRKRALQRGLGLRGRHDVSGEGGADALASAAAARGRRRDARDRVRARYAARRGDDRCSRPSRA